MELPKYQAANFCLQSLSLSGTVWQRGAAGGWGGQLVFALVRFVWGGAAAEAAEAGELLEEGVEINLQPTLAEMLDEGIARLKSPQGTWKLWQWPGCPTDFFSADDFKCGPAPACGGVRVGHARSPRVVRQRGQLAAECVHGAPCISV